MSTSTADGLRDALGAMRAAPTAVSADPPTLLVCINRASPVPEAVRGNGAFGVSLLAANQHGIADTFAGRPTTGVGPYDFGVAEWTQLADRGPLVAGAVAHLHCELERLVDVATHVMLVGGVMHAATDPTDPLTYCGAMYGRRLLLAGLVL